jgi:hypothetical protein
MQGAALMFGSLSFKITLLIDAARGKCVGNTNIPVFSKESPLRCSLGIDFG